MSVHNELPESFGVERDGTGGRIIGLPSKEVEDRAETRQDRPLVRAGGRPAQEHHFLEFGVGLALR